MNKAIKTLTDWYAQDMVHRQWELWQTNDINVHIRLSEYLPTGAVVRWDHVFAVFELTTARIDIMDVEIQTGIDQLATATQPQRPA